MRELTLFAKWEGKAVTLLVTKLPLPNQIFHDLHRCLNFDILSIRHVNPQVSALTSSNSGQE